jgi:hypothetical protein
MLGLVAEIPEPGNEHKLVKKKAAAKNFLSVISEIFTSEIQIGHVSFDLALVQFQRKIV